MPMKEAATRLSDGPFGSNLKSEHYRPEGVRVIRLQNICDGYFLNDDKAYVGWDHYEKLKKYTCHAGDIVIGTLGEPNLRACLIPDNIETAINKADCVQYIPRPELLDKRFVCAFINSPATLEMAIGDVHGNTRQRISSGQLAKLPIMIPPMELQEEYAAFIEQSDKSKFTVGRRFKSQFIERFEGQGYAVVKAKTFMTNMRNGVSPSKKGLHAEKVLTLSAVTQGAFDPEAWKDGIFDECPPADKRIHTSEFYMCRGNGNKMLVGTAVFSPENHDDLVFPDTVIAAHIDSNIILLPYLFVAWKMPSVRKQIEENARTTNGTYKINQTVLSNIELIVPPLEKQNEFVSFVEQSDKSKLSVQNKLSAFRRLTYRILQFEGGLKNVQ